jgi:hypothetical protein
MRMRGSWEVVNRFFFFSCFCTVFGVTLVSSFRGGFMDWLGFGAWVSHCVIALLEHCMDKNGAN